MGKLIAVLIPLLTVWATLAKIFPDWFEVRRDHLLVKALWGSKSRWVATILIAVLAGFYIWSLENRLNKSAPEMSDSIKLGCISFRGDQPQISRGAALQSTRRSYPKDSRTSMTVHLFAALPIRMSID